MDNFALNTNKMVAVMRGWLLLAVFAVAIAGLLAILLVAARTPVLQNFFPYQNFFHSALVVHVDLSVLIWLLSVSAILWCSICRKQFSFIAKSALISAIIGMVLIAASPFLAAGEPLMNNYVPVLQNLPFFLGLAFFSCAIVMQLIITLLSYSNKLLESVSDIAIYSSAMIAMVSIISIVISHHDLKILLSNMPSFDTQHYYELLFWSGGHLLQFSYTELMQLVWFIFALANFQNSRLFKTVFILNIIFTLPMLSTHFIYEIAEPAFRGIFTEHMRYYGGISASLVALMILIKLKQANNEQTKYLLPSVITSALLFFAGGIIGIMISGTNVTIPAHYHGSVVGVTVSFMGLIYYLIPALNLGSLKTKLIKWQIYCLGLGQLFHISGLAWSGGYGVLRKTPGAMQTLEGQAGMALMGMGGLLAVIGGVLFIYITLSAIIPSLIKKNNLKYAE